MQTPSEIFETKAHYNKWLKELTDGEKDLVLEMLKETKQESNLVENRVVPKIVKTLREKIEEAFNDMTTIYAPELTGDGKDKLAKKIQKYGKGTLGYISDKRNETIKTLEELLSNFMV